MAWRVRPANTGDGAAIVAVQTAAWQTAYAGLLPADRLALLGEPDRQARSAALWAQRAGDLGDGNALLVAEVDGAVSGFSATSPAEASELGASVGALNVFHVHPDQWGTGLAPALMAATVDALRGAGFRRAFLWTLRDAGRARRFYEREGWTHDGHTQTDLAKPLWHDLEVPQVRYITDLVVSAEDRA